MSKWQVAMLSTLRLLKKVLIVACCETRILFGTNIATDPRPSSPIHYVQEHTEANLIYDQKMKIPDSVPLRSEYRRVIKSFSITTIKLEQKGSGL
jgi:hypothetical protein